MSIYYLIPLVLGGASITGYVGANPMCTAANMADYQLHIPLPLVFKGLPGPALPDLAADPTIVNNHLQVDLFINAVVP